MNKNKLMTGAVSIALAVTTLSTTAFAAATSFTDVDDNHRVAISADYKDGAVCLYPQKHFASHLC